MYSRVGRIQGSFDEGCQISLEVYENKAYRVITVARGGVLRLVLFPEQLLILHAQKTEPSNR